MIKYRVSYRLPKKPPVVRVMEAQSTPDLLRILALEGVTTTSVDHMFVHYVPSSAKKDSETIEVVAIDNSRKSGKTDNVLPFPTKPEKPEQVEFVTQGLYTAYRAPTRS